jgi:hypothetical protein
VLPCSGAWVAVATCLRNSSRSCSNEATVASSLSSRSALVRDAASAFEATMFIIARKGVDAKLSVCCVPSNKFRNWFNRKSVGGRHCESSSEFHAGNRSAGEVRPSNFFWKIYGGG